MDRLHLSEAPASGTPHPREPALGRAQARRHLGRHLGRLSDRHLAAASSPRARRELHEDSAAPHRARAQARPSAERLLLGEARRPEAWGGANFFARAAAGATALFSGVTIASAPALADGDDRVVRSAPLSPRPRPISPVLCPVAATSPDLPSVTPSAPTSP